MQDDLLLAKLFSKVNDLDEYIRREMVTRREHDQLREDVIVHVDSFVKLHETLDQELVALRSKVDRLEDRVVRLESRISAV